jgi:hypothetical protein
VFNEHLVWFNKDIIYVADHFVAMTEIESHLLMRSDFNFRPFTDRELSIIRASYILVFKIQGH